MGGDHKCPLCDATFTRPQHVGRHLRSHTGDRPYECKECPLRFARSDLLSRHVNKTHRQPEQGGGHGGGGSSKAQPSKKGRRKSMPSTARATVARQQQSQPEPTYRRASFDVGLGANGHEQQEHQQHESQASSSANSSPPPPHNPPAAPPPVTLQAQSMYPHHPLLAGPPNAQWTGSPPMDMSNVNLADLFSMAPLINHPMPNPAMGHNRLYTRGPTRLSESDQGGVPNMYRGTSTGTGTGIGSLNAVGYEFGFKKKACDQCNHSKVRCDFAVPCHRCSHRNLQCSYNKPQKSRSIITSPSQKQPSSSPAPHFSSPPHSDPSAIAGPMPPASGGGPGQPVYAWMTAGSALDTFPALQPSPQNTMFSSSPSTYGRVPNPAANSQSRVQGQGHSGSSSHSSNLHVPLANATSPATTTELSEPANAMSYSPWITGTAPTAEPEGFSTSDLQKSQPVDLSRVFPQELNAMGWASRGQMTMDPRPNRRSDSIHSDTASDAPSSSGNSIFHDSLDDAGNRPLTAQGLRRASLAPGTWANAFHQMSLQDPSLPPMPTDPFTASQIAQQMSANRSLYPGASYMSGQSDNVKDLWKLFMHEPMHASSSNGPVAAGAASDAIPIPGLQQPTTSPTKAMAKSNSMPELSSPLAQANNQAFFSTFTNGPTPKPTLPQGSYTQPQVAEQGLQGLQGQSKVDDDHAAGEADDQAISRWKDQLKNRQNSFEFAPTLNSKMAKSATPPDSHSSHRSPPASATATASGPDPPTSHSAQGNRPKAGVIQGALDQTLAPERAPSFGVDGLPTPTKGIFTPRPSKLTSALARPGTKRIASQTLVPSENGKKTSAPEHDSVATTSSLSTATGTGDSTPKFNEPFVIPHGLASGTGMTPGAISANPFFTWPVPSGSTPAA